MNASPRAMDQLGAEMLDYLRIGGAEVALAAGETILHKGDPGVAVHFILTGEGVTFLTLACVGVVLLAGAISATILWGARKRCRTELRPIAPPAWRGVTVVWLVSVVLSLALVL